MKKKQGACVVYAPDPCVIVPGQTPKERPGKQQQTDVGPKPNQDEDDNDREKDRVPSFLAFVLNDE